MGNYIVTDISNCPAAFIDDKLVWGIFELTSLLVVGEILGFDAKAVWGNYVQLNPYISVFKGLYMQRNSFNKYLDEAVMHIRQNPFAGK